MKNILKPTFWKIALTFIFFIITSLIARRLTMMFISDTFPWGFPLRFYLGWGPCPPGEICFEFNGLWLALDIVIWYLVSTFIVSRFKRTG
jgi:hypothetical protein